MKEKYKVVLRLLFVVAVIFVPYFFGLIGGIEKEVFLIWLLGAMYLSGGALSLLILATVIRWIIYG